MQSLQEHAVPLITALTFLVVACVGFIWRGLFVRLDKFERMMETIMAAHDNCQKALPLVYVTKSDFEKFTNALERDRRERWDALREDLKEILNQFRNHTHSENGRVVTL